MTVYGLVVIADYRTAAIRRQRSDAKGKHTQNGVLFSGAAGKQYLSLSRIMVDRRKDETVG